MFYVYLTVLLYTIFRAVRGVVRTNASLRWIIKHSTKPSSKNSGKPIMIYFLIPVLREQEIIKGTFNNFTKLLGNYKVVFITTNKELSEKSANLKLLKRLKFKLLHAKSKEAFTHICNGIFPRSLGLNLYGKGWDEILKAYKELPSTRSLLNNLIDKSSLRIKSLVKVYNYPKTSGNMSEQLNFALKKLTKTEDLNNTYVCVYNADSIISRDFPNRIKSFINKNPRSEVIQQSALFLSNFHGLGNSISGRFLRSIALLQSRWTLAHELPRIFNQLKSNGECAHIVGHGLIIKLGVMKKAGYFPTNYINEDLPFGYILKLNGFDIYPFPLLENAQSPTSIKSMFTQYTTWFYGAFHYPKYMLNAFRDFPRKRLQALVWGIKYSIRSFLWLGLSFAWMFLFVYPVLAEKPYLLLISVATFVIYAPFCFWMIESVLSKKPQKIFGVGVSSGIQIDTITYAMSIFAYITHSYGPVIATIETIKSFLFGNKIRKMKTER